MKQPDTSRFSPKPEPINMDNVPSIKKPGDIKSSAPDRVERPQMTHGANSGTSTASITQIERPNVRPYGRTTVRRATKRYAFEFYTDQILKLKERALTEQLNGRSTTMSDMVRQAVDEHLAKPYDRTDER